MEKFDINKQYPRHKNAYAKGGFHMSYVKDTKARDIVNSVIKQMGQKLLKGELKDLMGISKPVALSKHLTYMEILSNDFYFQKHLQIAAQNSDNPLLQMQQVVTHIIASQHVASTMLYTKAPLDNVTGETCHLSKPNGSNYYAECISSSPPVAVYQIIGPNNEYKIYGSHQTKVTLSKSLNTLYGETQGKKIIDFGNGNQYECEYPKIVIEGILMGERVLYLYDTFKVINKKTKLYAEIQFGYEIQGGVQMIQNGIGRIGNLFMGKKQDCRQKKRPDDFDVQIYKQQQMGEYQEVMKATISEGYGNWLEYIQFDNQILWKIDEQEDQWQYNGFELFSDAQIRKDRNLIEQGQYELAEKSLGQRIINNQEENYLYARELRLQNKFDEALQIYQDLIDKQDGEQYDLVREKAHTLSEQGSYAKAIPVYELCISLYPPSQDLKAYEKMDLSNTYIGLARAYSEKKNYDEAHNLLDKAKRECIENLGRIKIERALIYIKQNKRNEAKELLLDVSQTSTNQKIKQEALFRLGFISTNAKQALDYYLKADQQDDAILFNIGNCYLKLGKYDGAKEYYKRALELNRDPNYLFNYAKMFELNGQYEDAKEEYERALSLLKNNTNAVQSYLKIKFSIGNCELHSGNFDKSIQFYEQVLKSENKDVFEELAIVYFNKGMALYQKGEMEKAVTEYLQALEQDPSLKAAHFQLGCILVDKKKYQEAIEKFYTSLSTENEDDVYNAKVHNDLGYCFTQLGDFQNAVNHFQIAQSKQGILKVLESEQENDVDSLTKLLNMMDLTRENKQDDEKRQLEMEIIQSKMQKYEEIILNMQNYNLQMQQRAKQTDERLAKSEFYQQRQREEMDEIAIIMRDENLKEYYNAIIEYKYHYSSFSSFVFIIFCPFCWKNIIPSDKIIGFFKNLKNQ
ncbi:hypothetical protein IMG5_185070 [Ichthyophthirius multifiliis]|uniref:Tetratricopeptide repeat protein n=1 Tax=Ichthyophthirius multifiliis TaxID=5932 RepID=G0R3F4_ICHMU|nr:hypothetical protein IMG5_185070 [Ichthyophthirius multifiliis]EGR28005.1 hypothetical protein IMG5_185070 [Ichthyophthirius multifiliis]|eukprot:XP_004027350.1 hypothetical protein IMG5_185070 [Ichthyophthirius multifiliis]